MRRDYFTLDVANVDSSGMPTVHIDFEGPSEQLSQRLTDASGEPLDADEIDVAYRLLDPVDEDDAEGVVSVTNRVTGEFMLELNAGAADVLAFIDAARDYGSGTDGSRRYRVRITVDGEPFLDHEKATLLVYEPDGDLLRAHSLIPSGVEL
jgi:hypothetical protein